MQVVTSNEQYSMSTADRQADVQAIYATFQGSSTPIVMWQELRYPAHHAEVLAVSPANTYHAFPDIQIGVNIPPRYEVMSEQYYPTKPETTDYDFFDAARWVGVLKLRDTTLPGVQPFYLINTHFPHGCAWDDPDPTPVMLKMREYWTTHYNVLKSKIDAIKSSGFTVCWGGDHNRKDAPKIATNEKLAVGATRVDKLISLDRSVITTILDTGRIVTLSDHDAWWVKWALDPA